MVLHPLSEALALYLRMFVVIEERNSLLCKTEQAISLAKGALNFRGPETPVPRQKSVRL
jgi:hypothetical protein